MNMFNLSIEEDWRKIKMVKVTVEALKETILEEKSDGGKHEM